MQLILSLFPGVDLLGRVCLCGRQVTPPAKHATAACRKRMERRRHNHTRVLTLPTVKQIHDTHE